MIPDNLRYASEQQRQAYLTEQSEARGRQYDDEQAAKETADPKAPAGPYTAPPAEGAHITRQMVTFALHKAESIGAVSHPQVKTAWDELYSDIAAFDEYGTALGQAIARALIPLPGAVKLVTALGGILTRGRRPSDPEHRIPEIRSAVDQTQACFLDVLHVAGGTKLTNDFIEFIAHPNRHPAVAFDWQALEDLHVSTGVRRLVMHTAEFLKDAGRGLRLLGETDIRSTSELADSGGLFLRDMIGWAKPNPQGPQPGPDPSLHTTAIDDSSPYPGEKSGHTSRVLSQSEHDALMREPEQPQ